MSETRPSDEPRTATSTFAPRRRTVVAAGTWTAPVVLTALGAPLAAASGRVRTLAFDAPEYAITPYRTFGDVVVTARVDGRPAAGVPVRFELPSGTTWADFARVPRLLITDGTGRVVLGGDRDAIVSVEATPMSGPLTASAPGFPAAPTNLTTVAEDPRHIEVALVDEPTGPLSGSANFRVRASDGDVPAPIGTPITVTPIEPGTAWFDGSNDGRVITITEEDGTAEFAVRINTSINRSGELRVDNPDYGSASITFEVAGFGRIWFEPDENSAPVGEVFQPFVVRTSDGGDNEINATITVTLPDGYSWADGFVGPREMGGGDVFEGQYAIRAAAAAGNGGIEATGNQLEHGSGGLVTTSGASMTFLQTAYAAFPDAEFPIVDLMVQDAWAQPAEVDVTLVIPSGVTWDGVAGASAVLRTDRGSLSLRGLRSGGELGPAGEIVATAAGFPAARVALRTALAHFEAESTPGSAHPGASFSGFSVSLGLPDGLGDPLSRPILAVLAGGPSWADGSPATRTIQPTASSLYFGDGGLQILGAAGPGAGTLTLSGDAFDGPISLPLSTSAAGRLMIRPLQDSVPPGEVFPTITIEVQSADGTIFNGATSVTSSVSGGVHWRDGDTDPIDSWVYGSRLLSRYSALRAGDTPGTGVLTVTATGFAPASHTFRIE
ncbi:hypothetical protein HQQ81_05430 [Microbacteriaceae bacterium VKM Ac-2854]|nr:hypothetical protein [Microbacteriaceae bacterium VKM Ac-2854]